MSLLYRRASRNLFFFSSNRQVIRSIATHGLSKTYILWPRRVAGAGIVLATTGLVISWSATGHDGLLTSTEHNEPCVRELGRNQQVSLTSLIRAYFVYSLCSMPTLIDWAPTILDKLLAIPGVNYLTKTFVRATFFSQFVGGESAEETIPILQQLRAEHKGALLAYSIEVDEDEASGKNREVVKQVQPIHKRIVEEMIKCINVAADFEDKRSSDDRLTQGRRTWVAVKLTALVPDAQALLNFSSYLLKTRTTRDITIPFPGCPHSSDLDVLQGVAHVTDEISLSSEDITALKELRDDLYKICTRAYQRQVKVIIDAEHSWYQPAIDAFTLDLMREFNKIPDPVSSRPYASAPGREHHPDLHFTQPLVYATFQAYLRRTPAYILQSLQDARQGKYVLGVKLVRGAYHPHEILSHYSSNVPRNDVIGSSITSSEQIFTSSHGFTRDHAESLSISSDTLPPVYIDKEETDRCYNAVASLLLQTVKQSLLQTASDSQVGILFGTHNRRSCEHIIETMVQLGLASEVSRSDQSGKIIRVEDFVAERVALGQLYGMSDVLTNSLVKGTNSTVPFVIKYVPYGGLSDVMPYLGRRAIENKSVLGNGAAIEERRIAWAEIRKRFFGI